MPPKKKNKTEADDEKEQLTGSEEKTASKGTPSGIGEESKLPPAQADAETGRKKSPASSNEISLTGEDITDDDVIAAVAANPNASVVLLCKCQKLTRRSIEALLPLKDTLVEIDCSGNPGRFGGEGFGGVIIDVLTEGGKNPRRFKSLTKLRLPKMGVFCDTADNLCGMFREGSLRQLHIDAIGEVDEDWCEEAASV